MQALEIDDMTSHTKIHTDIYLFEINIKQIYI